MTSKVFFDTNILTYSVDRHNRMKQKRCRVAIRSAQDSGGGVVSTQVLQEFYVTATRKLSYEALAAKEMLHAFSNLEVITVTPTLIESAIDCSILARLSFWDGLIVVCAEQAKCAELWTEDLNHGQIIRGVRVVNPFAA